MGRDRDRQPLTAQAAWQMLLGTWVHRVDAPGSWCEGRLQFTPDRRWVRTNLLAGGVVPGVETHRSVTQIVAVAVEGDAVRVTLGAKSNPLARPGGTMTIRFLDADRLLIEDGPIYTRVWEQTEEQDPPTRPDPGRPEN